MSQTRSNNVKINRRNQTSTDNYHLGYESTRYPNSGIFMIDKHIEVKMERKCKILDPKVSENMRCEIS